jgi:hypothetical protein
MVCSWRYLTMLCQLYVFLRRLVLNESKPIYIGKGGSRAFCLGGPQALLFKSKNVEVQFNELLTSSSSPLIDIQVIENLFLKVLSRVKWLETGFGLTSGFIGLQCTLYNLLQYTSLFSLGRVSSRQGPGPPADPTQFAGSAGSVYSPAGTYSLAAEPGL